MTNLIEKTEFKSLDDFEAWLTEVKEVLELSPAATKEEVLEEVERLNSEIATYEKEKAVVVAAFEKGSWEELMKDGALIRAGIIAGLER